MHNRLLAIRCLLAYDLNEEVNQLEVVRHSAMIHGSLSDSVMDESRIWKPHFDERSNIILHYQTHLMTR